MPVIKEYTSPIDQVRPSDVGVEALQRAGRMVGTLGNEAGRMDKEAGEAIGRGLNEVAQAGEFTGKMITQHQEQQEVLTGGKNLTDIMDQMSDRYNQAVSSDPTNPDIPKNFRSGVLEDTLQQWQDGFSTPKGKMWAAEQANKLREHYQERGAADAMTGAGMAVEQNLTQSTNNLSAMVAKDPSTLDFALDTMSGLTQHATENSTLHPEMAAKVKTELDQKAHQELVASALKAAIDKDPASGLAMLQSGKYDKYIGDHYDTLQKYAEHVSKAQDLQSKADDQTARKMEDDQFKTYATQLQQSTVTDKGEALPPDYFQNLTKIATSPGGMRNPELVKALSDYGQKIINAGNKPANGKLTPEQKANATTDPAAMDSALQGALPAHQILNMVGHGLSTDDAAWLTTQNTKQQMNDLGSLSTMLQNAKFTLQGGQRGQHFWQSDTLPDHPSQAGLDAYYRAQQYAIQKYRQGQQFGLSAADMTNPNSKDYIFAGDKLQEIAQTSRASTTLQPVAAPGATEPPHFLHPFRMDEAVPATTPATGGGQNNPGNIRVPGSTGTGRGAFQSFNTPEEGRAAIGDQLARYQARGVDTLGGMIARYSPPNENNTPALIAAASARTGIAANAKVDMGNPDTRERMINAIITQEQGSRRPSLASIFGGGNG